jgi:hypothetical protein
VSAPTNISFLTATDLGSLPANVVQQVDDSGTIYTVYYKFTVPTGTIQMGVFGFGDLTRYKPVVQPYLGPAASPTPVAGGAILGHNVPIQFPVTAGQEYFLEISKQFGATTPSILTLTAYIAPDDTVIAGSIAVNDDNDIGLPLALMSSTADYTVLKFVGPFPSGEAGDTLVSGIVAVEDISDGSVKIFDTSYTQLDSHILVGNLRIRTCIGQNKFYVGTSTNPVLVYTVVAAGNITGPESLTGMTSCNAIAASNDGTILYHVFTGNNVAIRKWDLVGHTALANLVAGIVNYATIDILVLSDDSIVVSYYKSTVTRDFKVIRYDAAGTLLNTYTGFPLPSGVTAPRLAYAIDDPDTFWVMIATSTAGLTQFINVNVADGSFLTTRNQEQFENGQYGGAQTATPVASFGAAFSCPFWIVRVIPVSSRSGIYYLTGTGSGNPTQRHDTLWIDASLGTTEDVKIP